MVKLLAAVLIIVAVLGGAYFVISNKPQVVPSSVSQTVQNTVQKVQPLDTSDAALDEDLTALERDLAEINNIEAELSQGIDTL